MAKNVSIIEDGTPKVLSGTTKIRTSIESGGTCDWIPKDDVPLTTLFVSEDGVYNPENGVYGFSQVVVSGVGTAAMGDLIEKTVTKNGTYNITDENGKPYGYSMITVNVDADGGSSGGGGGSSGGGGGSPVVGKDEDGNDTMAEADDDGNIVMTALPTEIKVIIPPTKLEYNRYEKIDYSGISVYAYISKAVHSLGTTTTVVSEGSSNNTVSIGGNNVTASIGDGVLYAPDRTGANDIQLVWDGAKWVKPSSYSAEKAEWTSDKYSTAKIPFGELIFPIERLSGEEKIGSTIETRASGETSVNVSNNFSFSYDGYPDSSGSPKLHVEYKFETDAPACGGLGMMDNGLLAVHAYSTSEFNVSYEGIVTYRDISREPTITKGIKRFNVSGNTSYARHNVGYIFYSCFICYLASPLASGCYPIMETLRLNNIHRYNATVELMNAFKYGAVSKTCSVTLPVQWKRPGDGKILEATFTAWMKDDGGDNNAAGGNVRPGNQNIDVPQ